MSMHDIKYEGIDCQELLEQLKESDSLHEQADIIHFLFITKCVSTRNVYGVSIAYQAEIVYYQSSLHLVSYAM